MKTNWKKLVGSRVLAGIEFSQNPIEIVILATAPLSCDWLKVLNSVSNVTYWVSAEKISLLDILETPQENRKPEYTVWDCFPLFSYMSEEYGLTLTETELHEITLKAESCKQQKP